jgi:hypothetical protein
MPIPKPKQDENTKDYIARCMSNDTMVKDFQDNGQRYAVCISQTKQKNKGSILEETLEALNYIIEYEQDTAEIISIDNIIIPNDNDYIDFSESTEEFEVDTLATFKFVDPITDEVFYYDRMGSWRKNGRVLIFKGKAEEYKGRKVTLNKPFRTSNGPKKFAVYVKNESGNVVIVRFGDPNMKIKKNIPERRRSFRARHNCDNPGPKWKARYWSCKAW